MQDISIVEYKGDDASGLLRLLLELHTTYFYENADRQVQELNQEIDITRSYEKYLIMINESNDDTWKTFFALTSDNKMIGFIIGSYIKDTDLVKSNIGKIEDWFVKDEYRGKGIGMNLYNELEKWFKEKGCEQVISDTWNGNELSIKAHQQLGFFVSGIQFGKILK